MFGRSGPWVCWIQSERDAAATAAAEAPQPTMAEATTAELESNMADAAAAEAPAEPTMAVASAAPDAEPTIEGPAPSGDAESSMAEAPPDAPGAPLRGVGLEAAARVPSNLTYPLRTCLQPVVVSLVCRVTNYETTRF